MPGWMQRREDVLSEPQSPENKSPDKPKKETVAVALSTEASGQSAPRVIAGGRGAVAEQIIQIAFANDVKVREDADLAEVLSAVEVDSEIPLEALVAVAEILAYVYRANGTPPATMDPPVSGPPPTES